MTTEKKLKLNQLLPGSILTFGTTGNRYLVSDIRQTGATLRHINRGRSFIGAFFPIRTINRNAAELRAPIIINFESIERGSSLVRLDDGLLYKVVDRGNTFASIKALGDTEVSDLSYEQLNSNFAIEPLFSASSKPAPLSMEMLSPGTIIARSWDGKKFKITSCGGGNITLEGKGNSNEFVTLIELNRIGFEIAAAPKGPRDILNGNNPAIVHALKVCRALSLPESMSNVTTIANLIRDAVQEGIGAMLQTGNEFSRSLSPLVVTERK